MNKTELHICAFGATQVEDKTLIDGYQERFIDNPKIVNDFNQEPMAVLARDNQDTLSVIVAKEERNWHGFDIYMLVTNPEYLEDVIGRYNTQIFEMSVESWSQFAKSIDSRATSRAVYQR